MKRIHLEDFSVEGTRLILRGTSCHRARNVLRVRPGANMIGSDASGRQYFLTVTEVHPEQVTCRVEHVVQRAGESPLRITLAQAIPRAARMDLIVQKATELGVSRIVPLLAQRTVARLDASAVGNKGRRWERISAEAVSQCGRSSAPLISPPLKLEDYLLQKGAPFRLLLNPGPGSISISKLPRESPGEVDVMIGPEGGWSPSETATCLQCGFIQVSLGPRILRTETAGLVILALLQQRWGDLA